MIGLVPGAKQASKVGAAVVKAGEAISSRAARRQAMREAGIPTSQQPSSQSHNKSGRELIYDVPKSGGGFERKAVQQQTLDRNHKDKPHWEAGAVKKDDAGAPAKNRYGRERLKNDKSKVEYDK